MHSLLPLMQYYACRLAYYIHINIKIQSHNQDEYQIGQIFRVQHISYNTGTCALSDDIRVHTSLRHMHIIRKSILAYVKIY